MGFFDTIERVNDAEAKHFPPAKISDSASQDTGTQTQPRASQPEKKAERRRQRFSFLRPCPLCGGKKFIHGQKGGFFCQLCQLGIIGTPVEAGGPDRQKQDQEAGPSGGSSHDNTMSQARGYFLTAWSWIKGNMPELLKAGWTRAALLQRSKHKYPLTWGVAWFSIWHEDAFDVTIGPKGEIVFSFQACGKTITQTARPPLKKMIIQ
jgi:hypothetical protein